MVDDDLVLQVAAYVEHGEAANLPELADLPGWLRRHPPERPELGEFTIGCYVAASERCPWAWEGLRRLLQETQGREPDVLTRWACDMASGRRREPPKPRGQPRNDDRNLRLYLAWLALGGDREANEYLETALGWEESTIRKNLPRRDSADGVGAQILQALRTGRQMTV